MILEKLILHQFRSYKVKEFVFSPGSTLIIGDNASGKTNLMEAVWMLARGKSFRAKLDREMIKYGEELGRVEGIVGEDELEVVIIPHKRFFVNGVPRRRMDFVGKLPAVLFRPEDMELLTGSPHVRREYLDAVLEQVDSEYCRSLLSYKKGLRQRNKLLERIRENQATLAQLLFWDQLLIKNGEVIAKKREELTQFVNEAFGRDKISQVFGGLTMIYDRSVISEGRLEQYAEAEVAAGVTLVGPHRDDFKIISELSISQLPTSNGQGRDLSIYGSRGEPRKTRDLSVYGSRGEQRLAVLALKLAELSFVTGKIGERPLLLLDDIFSELDHQHREDVLQVVGQQQTILTTTDLHLVELKYRKKMEVINLAI